MNSTSLQQSKTKALNHEKLFIFVCISFFIIALDQLTKLLIQTQFDLHESQVIVLNFFNLTYVRNYGAAFGFLSSSPHVFREVFFLSMPPLACGLILYILLTLKNDRKIQEVALASIFGGALGNYVDRLHYRYVIDFIDFHYKEKLVWPAFNLADVFIVTGVLILVYCILTEDAEKGKNVSPS